MPTCKAHSEARSASLRIYAASSLTDAFAELEAEFERENPEVDVVVTLAGSQVLALQLEQGAPAELFASAHEEHVDRLRAAGLVTHSEVFAANELVVIVPLANPAGLAAFEDLPRARRIVTGAADLPIGVYTRELLARADARYGEGFGAAVDAHVVSRESNVRLVRAKVALGEADAAIVYRSDALTEARVRTLEIPGELQVPIDYHLAELAGAARPELARRWVEFLRGAEGRAVLVEHGFSPPETP